MTIDPPTAIALAGALAVAIERHDMTLARWVLAGFRQLFQQIERHPQTDANASGSQPSDLGEKTKQSPIANGGEE